MRSQKLIPALALAAGLAVPATLVAAPPAGATAMAATCRVEVDFVDANNVDETDNVDEIRINLGGIMYPAGNSWVNMWAGARAYTASFGSPSAVISSAGSALFTLSEVTPPWVANGTTLGTITARGSTCAGLATGQVATISKTISGNNDTFYSYFISLVMTGL
ncbi:hypothetical protein ETD86_53035 [Nonomuraea turkmeniaca]|uniref:Allene oxide cyclase barrel-like domain-containing protein n=1 Tax=Nonomuraea turkmeniaca TaxID=103838 RepID=A0A5S4EV18_9ACTN|nr:hypothetical protein [Nonomuraea turkmeniaca]TMR05619.1 hypothetical protein ETD86_53035 [Nonomuraea turkmeniaca]